MEFEEHINWFKTYSDKKIADAGPDSLPLVTKKEHTLAVLQNASNILAMETGDKNLVRLGQIAALYHDLGRFDQYLKFHTFKDALSCNHALLSVKIVKDQQRLQDEPAEWRRLVLAAIGLHNRVSLPDKLKPELRLLANCVRDADKLDILRVIAEHLAKPGPYNPTVILGLPDRTDIYSPRLIELVMAGITPAYQDLKTVNDFRLLLGYWYYDMNFETSRKMFGRSVFARRLLEAVPDLPHYREVKLRLLSNLEDGIK